MPISYKEDPHRSEKNANAYSNCERALEIYAEGGFDVQICAELKISTKTYKEWRNQFPEWDEMHHLGQVLSETWWIKQAVKHLATDKNTTFNSTLWYMIMRNKFNWGDRPGDRRRKINYGGSLAQKLKLLEKMLQEGEITTGEHHNFIDSLYKEAQIFEIYKLQPRVEKLLLDTALKNNEITQQEYSIKMADIDSRLDVLDETQAKSQSYKAIKGRNARDKASKEGGAVRAKAKQSRRITMERILNEK
jgi:polyhydroxyalkanoate synthesis regulator phasin